ncbi:MAG: DNA adenine methylase, partial [Nanoarchaeota archaeon]
MKNKCDLVFYSEDLRAEYKELLKTDLSLLDRAFYFWYVNRTSVNGVGGFSINSCVRRGMSKSTSDFLSCIDRLPEIHDRLSSVIISNKNALELIKEKDNKNTFYFLDPPYAWETRTSTRYAVDFSPEQQKQLVDILLTSQSKVLLCGYINKEYERLEGAGWKRNDFEVKTTDGNHNP